MSAKINEAQEHIKTAEKYLKTSFLKWKPDYDSAADEYSQAAQCFRIARVLENCRDCHLKAYECYVKNRSFFHAAKAIESAIIASKDVTPPEELYKMAEESCNLYQQHGSGDAAANILDKTAKIIEHTLPEFALRLFQHAADVSATESGQHQAAEYISKASRLLVKLGMYDQATDSLRREIGFHQEHGATGAIGRLTVAIVLVQLAREDLVAAEKVYKEWGNNCEAAEMHIIEQLLAAYDEEDRDAAIAALGAPFIKHMDVEYAKLAQSVRLPEGMASIVPRPTIVENAAPSYVSETGKIHENPEQPSSESAPPNPGQPPSEYAPHNPKGEQDEEGALC